MTQTRVRPAMHLGIALKTFNHSVRCVTHRRTGGIKLGNAKPFLQAPPRSLTVRTGPITSKSSHCKNKFSLGRRQLRLDSFGQVRTPKELGRQDLRSTDSTRGLLESWPVELPYSLPGSSTLAQARSVRELSPWVIRSGRKRSPGQQTSGPSNRQEGVFEVQRQVQSSPGVVPRLTQFPV